jgi:hypothetical protein
MTARPALPAGVVAEAGVDGGEDLLDLGAPVAARLLLLLRVHLTEVPPVDLLHRGEARANGVLGDQ